ncbi:hypothetical protein [Streptosporangium sp. NPDC023615]|uniref:hypothetical protein n=1 Tax=Streptosporangium sp. NPDC023615 TaxID=3154794 RepID=UPI00341C02FE
MIRTPGTARAARRIAAAAAVGGGGVTALGAAAYGLLLAEALVARRAVGRPHGMEGPPSDGVYGPFGGEPIRLTMLGDSLSVGLRTRPCGGCGRPGPRWSWAPARTWARYGRSRSRCAG